MRAAAFLRAAEQLPFADLSDLTGGRGFVVIAPHPDDESLGCGGLIAEGCARGMPVQLVVISDGVGSHPNSPSYPPPLLRALREEETRAAARVLGLSAGSIQFLGLPDRFVPRDGPVAEAAARAVAAAARDCNAGALFATWIADPHCDHQAAAAIARSAARDIGDTRQYAYPVWGWTLPDDAEVGLSPRGARLDIGHHLAAKRQAIAAHRSQTTSLIDDDPDGFRLDEAMLLRFDRPYEVFLEAAP